MLIVNIDFLPCFISVSAFYFECPKHNVCINASIYTKSKFMGMSIGVVMVGKGEYGS
jgi:hypothetical protein